MILLEFIQSIVIFALYLMGFCACIALGAKLLWNIALPYTLIDKLLNKADEKQSFSILGLAIEWGVFILALSALKGLHLFDKESALLWTTALKVGSGAIVLTYLHFMFVMIIGGLIVKWRRK